MAFARRACRTCVELAELLGEKILELYFMIARLRAGSHYFCINSCDAINT